MAKKKTSGGPGKKNCPGCEEYIGARSKVCPFCNYSYEEKKKVEPKKQFERTVKYADSPIWNDVQISNSVIKTFAASGKCPISLVNFTPKGIKKWADEVSLAQIPKGMAMTAMALYYFAMQFSPNYEEIKIIKKTLGVN